QGLRVLCEAHTAQRTRSLCVLCEASAPFAVKKHRNAVKKGRKILRLTPVFWTPHPIPHTLYPPHEKKEERGMRLEILKKLIPLCLVNAVYGVIKMLK
ncbi:MAG: hypothetical protein LBD35_05645, partial [Prevotellaceae bacterium]|nr:hypothetical protein [Prevotellaceae bacterium]